MLVSILVHCRQITGGRIHPHYYLHLIKQTNSKIARSTRRENMPSYFVEYCNALDKSKRLNIRQNSWAYFPDE